MNESRAAHDRQRARLLDALEKIRERLLSADERSRSSPSPRPKAKAEAERKRRRRVIGIGTIVIRPGVIMGPVAIVLITPMITARAEVGRALEVRRLRPRRRRRSGGAGCHHRAAKSQSYRYSGSYDGGPDPCLHEIPPSMFVWP